ncbi:MAG: HDOD domain-containing protein [Desulfobulbaceae bacterium]|uniref:HDOD domain-containing protein n=1 Tax=Candidatus Desulfobia pelagia TaxID=2841692 RepID=A0A8J6NFK0_9BACT|nr:HDOD domain-containing protein [Candidatus Desulfobia pelagia]
MESTIKHVAKSAKLISLPETYLRLKEILDEPDFTMAEVAILISQDPGLTVRLLRLVNSSFFGRSAKIETVSHAVSILGTQQIHDLVLATCVSQAFDGMSLEVMTMQRFWERSVMCGVNSQLLSSMSQPDYSERLFVCGLLHDVGHLIMYESIPEQCQQAIKESLESGMSLHKIEHNLFGFDYAQIGGAMMRHWGLPQSLWEPAQYHTDPEKAEQYLHETAIVHIGSLLTRAGDGEGTFDMGPLRVNPAAWEQTGLTCDQCLSIQDEGKDKVDEIMSLVFRK